MVQATLQAGFLTRLNNNLNVSICDQFFLGGPLSLRGFKMRGVGPHKDGNALGANVSNGCDTEMLNLLCSQNLCCTIVLYWFINALRFSVLLYVPPGVTDGAECVSVFCMMITIQRDYLPKHY